MAEREVQVFWLNRPSHSLGTRIRNPGGSMNVSSKLSTGRLLAVALTVVLWAVRVPVSQASGAQQCCPAQTIDTCVNAHALHESREACERQQEAYEHALHEAEEAREHAMEKVARANELSKDMCIAGVTVTAAQPESEIMMMKPSEPIQAGTATNIMGLSVADIYDRGVIVTDVDLGSRAGELGIRRGDVILAVNGEVILNSADFQKFVQQLEFRPMALTVSRFGQVNVFVMDRR
jgi:C-terminal processing protease CtpA/Prc